MCPMWYYIAECLHNQLYYRNPTADFNSVKGYNYEKLPLKTAFIVQLSVLRIAKLLQHPVAVFFKSYIKLVKQYVIC